MHGGASTGSKTPEGKSATVAAMIAGRAAWLERRRADKEAGLVEKLVPRHAQKRAATGSTAAKAYDPMVAKAQRIQQGSVASLAVSMPVLAEYVPPKDAAEFAEQSPPEQLATLQVKSIFKLNSILDMPIDLAEPNMRLLEMQKTTALDMLKIGQKQAASVIAAKTADSLIQLLDCLRKGERATFLDGEAEGG